MTTALYVLVTACLLPPLAYAIINAIGTHQPRL